MQQRFSFQTIATVIIARTDVLALASTPRSVPPRRRFVTDIFHGQMVGNLLNVNLTDHMSRFRVTNRFPIKSAPLGHYLKLRNGW